MVIVTIIINSNEPASLKFLILFLLLDASKIQRGNMSNVEILGGTCKSRSFKFLKVYQVGCVQNEGECKESQKICFWEKHLKFGLILALFLGQEGLFEVKWLISFYEQFWLHIVVQ